MFCPLHYYQPCYLTVLSYIRGLPFLCVYFLQVNVVSKTQLILIAQKSCTRSNVQDKVLNIKKTLSM